MAGCIPTVLTVVRRYKNLKQSQLAAVVGISQVEISYYETGSKKPTSDKRILLADYLGIPPEILLEPWREAYNEYLQDS